MSIYNLNGYNAAGYNVPTAPASVIAPTSLLTFNDFNCDDRTNMTISRIMYNSGHRRSVERFDVPRSHGERVANVWERGKIIKAIGKLEAADEDALEAYIDTVKKNLRAKRKKLITVFGSKTRVYEKATLLNMDSLFEDREHWHVDMVPFELQFLCEDFSTDFDYEQWSDEITSSEDTIEAEGSGTIEGKPVVVIAFSAATGVTQVDVTIDQNSQTIGYAGSISANDVLIFDSVNEQVTLNGTEVAFNGYFPEMPIGVNTFRFTTDGSSRTFRATILTKHAYL